jgi:hypothetical protein
MMKNVIVFVVVYVYKVVLIVFFVVFVDSDLMSNGSHAMHGHYLIPIGSVRRRRGLKTIQVIYTMTIIIFCK